MMNNPIFYWDACVFISWLKNEEIVEGGLAGTKQMDSLINKRKAILITSVITFTEVLQSQLELEKFNLFKKLFQRENIKAYNVDEDIAQKAGAIRDFYRKDRSESAIKTPDAIHIATAIHYGANVLCTFDGCRKQKGMLQFNGMIANQYQLDIKVPSVSLGPLFQNTEEE